MYSGNDIVLHYCGVEFEQYYGGLNRNPTRFTLEKRLEAPTEVFGDPGQYTEAIDHLVVNSMHAISGFYTEPEDVLRAWKPEKPGIIKFHAHETDERIYIDIEDNGEGIDPEKMIALGYEARAKIDPSLDPLDYINLAFTLTLSSKNTAGVGLAAARHILNELNGDVYFIGTSYRKDGKLHKVGHFEGDSTGTIIRMDFLKHDDIPF
jgi:hypothetical protein